MEFAIAKLSSKGQIVIPSQLRDSYKTGDEFLLVKQDENIVLKKMSNVAKDLVDDMHFAQEVELAWKEVEAGKSKRMSKEKFLKELEQW